MKLSLDTNILISDPEVLFDKEKEYVISFTVIRELDNLKRNPDLKFSAQMAIKNIWYQYERDAIEILNVPKILGESPDEKIIQDTKDYGARILSDDIAVRIIAKAHNVEISTFESDNNIDYDYSGFTEVQGDYDYESEMVAIKELMYAEMQHKFRIELKENEYLIVNRVSEKVDIWVRKGDAVKRISQSMKPYKDAGIMDTPLDSQQMCALDAVMDSEVPLTVIDGKLGTGKTLLSLMSALACTKGQRRFKYYDKIFITRPPVSTNRTLKLGYLPGTLEEKMGDWMGGIKSNLKFLLEKTEKARREENSTATFMEYFEMINIDSIQGTSLHNTILLVDEYQLLDRDTLKLVLSRISEGSKVVLIGDSQGQTYGVNRANEGFKVLYKHLGTAPEFNFVKLDNIYRSKLAKFVEAIFD